MRQFVPVDGCRLFTRTFGSEGQPWLMLANSLAADHTMWEPQIPWLCERYRVLAYDARGHGESDAPSGPSSFPQLVADVVAIMDHYRVTRAAYLGLSLGGMTGIGLALAHPDRLSRLICCDARANAPEAVVAGWNERIERVQQRGIGSILEETLERWLSPHVRASDPSAVAKVSEMIRRTSVAGYVACARALQTLAYAAALRDISVPTLFVVGADDMAAPASTMKAMAEAVPGARLEVIPRARHLANIDAPLGFRSAVAPFLDFTGSVD